MMWHWLVVLFAGRIDVLVLATEEANLNLCEERIEVGEQGRCMLH